MKTLSHVLVLPGLDGGNPLGFLATLGVLRTLTVSSGEMGVGLGWNASQQPEIYSDEKLTAKELNKRLLENVRMLVEWGIAAVGPIIGVAKEEFDSFAQRALSDGRPAAQWQLLFMSAYGSAAVFEPKKGTVIPSNLSLSNGQGGKLLLKDFQTLASRLTEERLEQALFQTWAYDDEDEPTFRWDPQDMRTGAHMATDPGSTSTRSVAGANTLAFVGMSYLVSLPTQWGLKTTGFRGRKEEAGFAWPLWTSAVRSPSITSLLQQEEWSPAMGVFASYKSPRINFKKNLYLGNAVAMDGSFSKE